MESVSYIGRMGVSTLSQIWQKLAGKLDFVWLARFRLLTIYTLFKGFLLLAAGMIGIRLNTFMSFSVHDLSMSLWMGITPGLERSHL